MSPIDSVGNGVEATGAGTLPYTVVATGLDAVEYRITVTATVSVAGSAGTIAVGLRYTTGAGVQTPTPIAAHSTSATGTTSATVTATMSAGTSLEYSVTPSGITGSPAYSITIAAVPTKAGQHRSYIFELSDPLDSTKRVRLDLSNQTTGTLRTLSFPVSDGTLSSGSGANSVTATVDFGATFSHFAQVVVTGQAWVAAGSEIVATVLAAAGKDMEAALFMFSPVVGTLSAGVGFTLSVYTPVKAKGTYNFSCVGV